MAGLTGFGGDLAANFQEVNMAVTNQKIYAKITEQPAQNKLRFRYESETKKASEKEAKQALNSSYECEGRSAGALQGASSSSDNKTYPAIAIEGYKGPAVVVVSCVEEKPPYRAHPHNLVGKYCRKGVCSMDIQTVDMTCTFQNLGVQCVKKKDAAESLEGREKIRVDPFKQGFKHKKCSNVNLNEIRLCFQVFLKVEYTPGQPPKLVPLNPLVSNVIKDKKTYTDLQIVNVSDNCAPVQGGKKILLFCEKVTKDDIEVHFSYYDRNGQSQILKGHFSPNDVHKQFGIAFTTPPFTDQNITSRVQTHMYLYRPSVQEQSEPKDFYFEPRPDKIRQQVVAERGAQKRTKARPMVSTNNSDDDPSSRQRAVPPKQSTHHPGSGGSVQVVKEEKNDDGMSFIDRVLQEDDQAAAAQAQLAASPQFAVPMYPGQDMNNMYSQQQQQQQQTQNGQQAAGGASDRHSHQLMSPGSSGILKGVDLDQLEKLANNFNSEVFDNISSEMGDLKLENNGAGANPRNMQRQNSQLDTPDVSMEQGGLRSSSSSMRRNNLNKF